MFKTSKHIEARTRRSEQHGIAGFRRFETGANRGSHRIRTNYLSRTAKLSLDVIRVLADQYQRPHRFLDKWKERGIRSVLPASAEYQNDLSIVFRQRLK